MGAPVRLEKAVSRSKETRRSGAPRGERPSHGRAPQGVSIGTAPFGAPLPSHSFCEGAFPLVRRGDGKPGAPRALREQGRRSFGCLKCESDVVRLRQPPSPTAFVRRRTSAVKRLRRTPAARGSRPPKPWRRRVKCESEIAEGEAKRGCVRSLGPQAISVAAVGRRNC